MSGKMLLVSAALVGALLDFTESLAAKVGVQSSQVLADAAKIEQEEQDKAALTQKNTDLQAALDAHQNDPTGEPLDDATAARIAALGVSVAPDPTGDLQPSAQVSPVANPNGPAPTPPPIPDTAAS